MQICNATLAWSPTVSSRCIKRRESHIEAAAALPPRHPPPSAAAADEAAAAPPPSHPPPPAAAADEAAAAEPPPPHPPHPPHFSLRPTPAAAIAPARDTSKDIGSGNSPSMYDIFRPSLALSVEAMCWGGLLLQTAHWVRPWRRVVAHRTSKAGPVYAILSFPIISARPKSRRGISSPFEGRSA